MGVQEINVICRALKYNLQAFLHLEQNCPLGHYNIITSPDNRVIILKLLNPKPQANCCRLKTESSLGVQLFLSHSNDLRKQDLLLETSLFIQRFDQKAHIAMRSTALSQCPHQATTTQYSNKLLCYRVGTDRAHDCNTSLAAACTHSSCPPRALELC